MFEKNILTDYESLINSIETDDNPASLPNQLDDLNLISKYLEEHSKVMNRNYLKPSEEIAREHLELENRREFLTTDVERLNNKISECYQLCDEASELEAELERRKKEGKLTRATPQRKSFRAAQKVEIKRLSEKMSELEAENLKLRDEIDASDAQRKIFEDESTEIEAKITKSSEILRDLKMTDRVLLEQKQEIQDTILIENFNIEKEVINTENKIDEVAAQLKEIEIETDKVRETIDILTNEHRDGTIDRNQKNLSAEIVKLQQDISNLKTDLKNTPSQIPSSKIAEANEQLDILKQRDSQVEREKLKKMNNKQLILKKRVDERPFMEERMKENIKWEVAEAEKNLDKLIEERNRYEKKLENLFNQSKKSGFQFSTDPYELHEEQSKYIAQQM